MDIARFWDRMAKGYAKRPISDPDAYEEKLRRTQAHLRPDMSVVEIGCGTGGTARRHAPLVARYRALDVSPEMIRIARERTGDDAPAGLSFEVRTLADAAGEGPVDAVLMLSLLHLLPDWREAVTGARAALKPGGLFVTSSVCFPDSHAWFRWIAPIGRAVGLFPPLAFFSRRELTEAMEAAGFDILDRWVPDPKAALFVIARAR